MPTEIGGCELHADDEIRLRIDDVAGILWSLVKAFVDGLPNVYEVGVAVPVGVEAGSVDDSLHAERGEVVGQPRDAAYESGGEALQGE
ncbi:TPA: hypothetical protein IYE65_002834 [Enterococcus faecium]|nr:hypothetical protein [Enterococcus faecium]HAQ9631180.1 hypothetical protein [Enterococcus faecium]